MIDHWPNIRLIHSKIENHHSTSQDSAFAIQLLQWYHGKKHKNNDIWPDYLFDFCYHLNTTTNPETGKIPHDIVFGKMLPQEDVEHIWTSILSKDSHIISNRSEKIIMK